MPNKTQTQQWLEDLGFKKLPAELRTMPLDDSKVSSLLNTRHDELERNIVNNAPGQIKARNRQGVSQEYQLSRAEFDKLDKARDGLVNLMKKNQLEEELKKLPETFKNSATRENQAENSGGETLGGFLGGHPPYHHAQFRCLT